MVYDFDEIIDRRGTGSIRWDSVQEKYGCKDVIPLTTADMGFRIAPPIRDAICGLADFGVFGYTAPRPSYYEAVRERFAQKWKWQIRDEWICYSAGIVEAVAYCIQGMTQPGDGIALLSPVYHPFAHLIEYNGRSVHYSRLRQDGIQRAAEIDFEDLERVLSDGVKMLIFCNPHNPIGRVWTREELEQLCRLCVRYGVILVSDEIHCDFVFSGSRFCSAAPVMEAAGGLDQLVICSAASKTFNVAGLHCSGIIIPGDTLRAKYRKVLTNQHFMEMNAVGPAATEAAYRYCQDWLDQLMVYLEDTRDYIVDFVNGNIPGMRAVCPEATYMIWLDCRAMGKTEAELNEIFSHKARVGLNMGSTFGPGGEGYVRLNFGEPRQVITEALERIQDALLISSH